MTRFTAVAAAGRLEAVEPLTLAPHHVALVGAHHPAAVGGDVDRVGHGPHRHLAQHRAEGRAGPGVDEHQAAPAVGGGAVAVLGDLGAGEDGPGAVLGDGDVGQLALAGVVREQDLGLHLLQAVLRDVDQGHLPGLGRDHDGPGGAGEDLDDLRVVVGAEQQRLGVVGPVLAGLLAARRRRGALTAAPGRGQRNETECASLHLRLPQRLGPVGVKSAPRAARAAHRFEWAHRGPPRRGPRSSLGAARTPPAPARCCGRPPAPPRR